MRKLLLGVVLSLVPALCLALDAPVRLAREDASLLQRVAGAAAHRTADIAGTGDRLLVRYSAQAPIEAVIFFQVGGANLNITTALTATLPPGNDAEATIDLTTSPTWNVAGNAYRIFFLSAAGASIDDVALQPVSLRRLPWIAVRHLFTLEPYQPSSYHRLKGYDVLGYPLPLLVLGTTLLALAVVMACRRLHLAACLTVLLVAFAFHAARSSVDLLRFTGAHLIEWRSGGSYQEAGAAHGIASFIEENGREGPVLLCYEGTSYIPTLFSYLLYPRLVFRELPRGTAPSYVVAFEQQMIQKDGSLRCGDVQLYGLERLRDFPGGSHVYRLTER